MSRFAGVFAISLARMMAGEPVLAFDPIAAYELKSAQGFTLLVGESLKSHPKEANEAMRELEVQLIRIDRMVPPEALTQLRKVRIWIEWESKQEGAAEFHPSANWLREHGYNPEKAGDVEINNVRNFVKWSRSPKPWMILHELAHAYHFRTLGEHHAGIEAASREAKTLGIYNSVGYVQGGKRKAYALTNAKEYFAELSEAYFDKNDFFPFLREELEKHDPRGFQLMRALWGRPLDEERPARPPNPARLDS